MAEITLLVILFLLVLLFAIIGFVVTLMWLSNGFKKSDTPALTSSQSQTATPTSENDAAESENADDVGTHSAADALKILKPQLGDDVLATRRFLQHLYQSGQIKERDFDTLRKYVEEHFGEHLKSTKFSVPELPSVAKPVPTPRSQATVVAASELAPSTHATPPTPVMMTSGLAATSDDSSPIVAVLVAEVVDDRLSPDDQSPSPVSLAPWDRPDPPARPPRRSFAELMSGFMQEKNMRWGELTSGILIVFSAIGLVVSLRDELSKSIPYFSSILFMLITALIIGAGIYTLKKWKLRNTSRGTLIIGLLLIPLNFVAACILSGGENRRELGDPWLWAAVIIGVSGFGALAWWGSKYLLRKHNWPITIAIAGCGAGTLLINRLSDVGQSSLHLWGLSLPLVGCYLIGSGVLQRRTARKTFWSPRATNRLLINLGLASFAILSALAMLFIRSDDRAVTTVATTPVLVIVSLVVAWLGTRIRQSVAVDGHDEIGSVNQEANSHSNNRLVGTSLSVLGLILTAIFLLVSVSNPLVFVVNCGLAIMALLFAKQGSLMKMAADPFSSSLAWSIGAAGGLTGLNLLTGHFGFDQWTSPDQWRTAILNGKSGLALLGFGLVAAAVQAWAARWQSDPEIRRSTILSGSITGGCIFLTGCAIALLASLVNRSNHFDTMTASGLLMLAGVGALVVSVIKNRRRDYKPAAQASESSSTRIPTRSRVGLSNEERAWLGSSETPLPAALTGGSAALDPSHPFVFPSHHFRPVRLLPNLAAGLLLAGLAHTLLWNPTASDWFGQLTLNLGANWIGVVGIHGLLLACVAAWMRPGEDLDVTQNWAGVTTGLAIAGAITLVPQHTGVATLVMFAMTIAAWYLSFNIARVGRFERSSIHFAGVPFVVATGLLVWVAIAEIGPRFLWCPDWTQPRHWLIQIMGLSAWSIVWTALARQTVAPSLGNNSLRSNSPRIDPQLPTGSDEPQFSFLNVLTAAQPRVDQVVVNGLILAMGSLIVGFLSADAMAELFASYSRSDTTLVSDQIWVFGSLALVVMAAAFQFVHQPSQWKAGTLVGLWFLAWSAGAIPFENSISTASALRWLLPIGGLVGAILVSLRRPVIPAFTAWASSSHRLGSAAESTFSPEFTQRLINLALILVAGVVLLISTVTVSQVMLNGVSSLGGPKSGSWFQQMDKVVSFGVPLALMVSTFLVYAISERRPWLATAGSTVFQYMVVLAIVLLFLSTDPRLLSRWFVRVLQSVSLGMTAYGFAWYFMRGRINGATGPAEPDSGGGKMSRLRAAVTSVGVNQIEIHTLINGLLVTSLAVLVYSRFFFAPGQPGDWVNSIGSLLGIVACASFVGLAFTVWRKRLWPTRDESNLLASSTDSVFATPTTTNAGQLSGWMWLLGWTGLVLVAVVAVTVDHNFEIREKVAPWVAFKILAAGSVLVAIVQTLLPIAIAWRNRCKKLRGGETHTVLSSDQRPAVWKLEQLERIATRSMLAPLFFSSAVGLMFAVRGAWVDASAFEFYLALVGAIVGLLLATGLLTRQSLLTFFSAGVSVVGTFLLCVKSPIALFATQQPNWINVSVAVISTLALANLLYYLWVRNWAAGRRFDHSLKCTFSFVNWSVPTPPRRSFLRLPNVTLLLGSIWIVVGSLFELILRSNSFFGNGSSLFNPPGIAAVVAVVLLLGLSVWNDRRKFWVASFCLTTLGIVIVGVSVITPDDTHQGVWVLLGGAVAMLGWAIVSRLLRSTRKLRVPRLAAFQRAVDMQIPIASLILMSGLILFSTAAILFVVDRPLRYATAAVPLLMAVAMGLLSDPDRRRWLQMASLSLVTLGSLFVGWADLDPRAMHGQSALPLLIRSLLVLAGTMFVYGCLISRWTRPGDSWLKSLREMAAVVCGFAVICFGFVNSAETIQFVPDVGCGLSVATAVAVAMVVLGMIGGLITIAVRPEHDPFSFSLTSRQIYVYLAQLVTAGLIVHLYFSMPFLFRFGIKEYWPYIAMAICFGGVGVAHLLQRRNLTVLGQPLFTTAAILPVLIAVAIFAIDSQADASLVMLTVGLAYLMISYLNNSPIAGAAGILFGNLALWIFYADSNFDFFQHPQWWLIPPAVSVLIAGQLNRNRLPESQLATLRYICLAVIYVSSTSEIFIRGLGASLWPPVILAVLAVIGIMAGIMLHIRSFLYLGSLFLLLAMTSMVAHAHQRLDSVWPWWAFGITLGISILVMFGMLEKKKNA